MFAGTITIPSATFGNEPQSLEAVLADAGLTTADWDEFIGVMTGDGSHAEKANYLCWMENYITQCALCPTCPGPNPFGK